MLCGLSAFSSSDNLALHARLTGNSPQKNPQTSAMRAINLCGSSLTVVSSSLALTVSMPVDTSSCRSEETRRR